MADIDPKGGFGPLRETGQAVFDDLQARNRQVRLTSSWLLTVSLLAAGYAWNVAEGAGGEAPGYYAIAVVFGASFGFFVWSVVSGKYWAMAYDLREIHQASWGEAVFTAGDANKGYGTLSWARMRVGKTF